MISFRHLLCDAVLENPNAKIPSFLEPTDKIINLLLSPHPFLNFRIFFLLLVSSQLSFVFNGGVGLSFHYAAFCPNVAFTFIFSFFVLKSE